MEWIGNCVWFFGMCGGGFGYSGGGGSGEDRGCSFWFLVIASMWWFCILYSFFSVFGKACVGQLFGHWL